MDYAIISRCFSENGDYDRIGLLCIWEQKKYGYVARLRIMTTHMDGEVRAVLFHSTGVTPMIDLEQIFPCESGLIQLSLF